MKLITTLCAAFVFSVVLLPSAEAQLELSAGTPDLHVSGLTAGGSVVVFGVLQDFTGGAMSVSTHFSIEEDSDLDGEIALALTQPESQHSSFVAIDLTSGETAAASPEGERLTLGQSPPAILTGEFTSEITGVGIKARMAAVLLVRPGVGAWKKIAGDGGPSDDDGRGNGTIVVTPTIFNEDENGLLPPTKFETGDVVVAINTYTRELHVVTLGEKSSVNVSEGN